MIKMKIHCDGKEICILTLDIECQYRAKVNETELFNRLCTYRYACPWQQCAEIPADDSMHGVKKCGHDFRRVGGATENMHQCERCGLVEYEPQLGLGYVTFCVLPKGVRFQ